jgi:predicted DsbA family dithiol-disulfide isomerase
VLVEIWSDVICPWCYIGKKHFETALAGFPNREHVKVVWRSFELDPNAPRNYSGSLIEHLSKKYGVSLPEAEAMNARVTGIAREAGVEYRLDRARPGNTFDAHRVLHLAASLGKGEAATERLMRAYFCDGFAVGSRDELARFAPELGLDSSAVAAMLADSTYSDAVRADEVRAAELGITGVPFFVLDEKFGVSGAQPTASFADVLQRAWAQHQA